MSAQITRGLREARVLVALLRSRSSIRVSGSCLDPRVPDLMRLGNARAVRAATVCCCPGAQRCTLQGRPQGFCSGPSVCVMATAVPSPLLCVCDVARVVGVAAVCWAAARATFYVEGTIRKGNSTEQQRRDAAPRGPAPRLPWLAMFAGRQRGPGPRGWQSMHSSTRPKRVRADTAWRAVPALLLPSSGPGMLAAGGVQAVGKGGLCRSGGVQSQVDAGWWLGRAPSAWAGGGPGRHHTQRKVVMARVTMLQWVEAASAQCLPRQA